MLNKVTLIGNLGRDPEMKNFSNGNSMVNLAIATTEKWKDKSSGEHKSKTEWHRVSVFGEGLVNVCCQYLKKGSKVYIEGKLQTRSYDKDGTTVYSTEIIVQGFGSKLVMLDNLSQSNDGGEAYKNASQGGNADTTGDFDDDIPF